MNDKIRNFCIIAHIDHGKSTLADRLLEITGTVEKRKMQNQILDSMELEREKGITIKLTPVRMQYKGYVLNLIDTPGHVDFNYEVSRSLAAVEGAILLIDATQGIQAQTIGNLYLALEQNLTIIPAINKIDLPAAQIEKTEEEIIGLIGCKKEDIIRSSGKTGEGVEKILEEIINKIPPPNGAREQKTRALIFDSKFDDFQGIIASVRVMDGELKKGDKIFFIGSKANGQIIDIGHYTPQMKSANMLNTGEIGFITAGLKDITSCRVGDTITIYGTAAHPLPGYKEITPMVFAGIFPEESNDYESLRKGIEKLKLNDAALAFEPERSKALGFGMRCGFLGLLHLEIFQERLKREYGIDITVTIPSVAYQVTLTSGITKIIKSPEDMPDRSIVEEVREPIVNMDIVTPEEYIGAILQLSQKYRGNYLNTEYLSQKSGMNRRIILHYTIPLSSILVDFYDKLKSASQGYASLNYEFKGYVPADIIKMDILVADEPVEALAQLVTSDAAFEEGKRVVAILKETLPRQQFVLKIQAAVGGKIIAAERLGALRKDVTAKLYGGDVTRKRKLLEKQKKGKKKMMKMGAGSVDIPPKVYLQILKK